MTFEAETDRPRVVFAAEHPQVGDLTVSDDGDEVTLMVGTGNHWHIRTFEEGLADVAREDRTIEEVLGFLEELFADRIEFWWNDRGGSSRQRKQETRGWFSRWFFGEETYVWSGPLKGGSGEVNTRG
jgi:hypothetical protein